MNFTNLFWLIVATALIALGLVWSNWYGNQADLAAQRYEACVTAQYHTTPAAWYGEHGEYPECSN